MACRLATHSEASAMARALPTSVKEPSCPACPQVSFWAVSFLFPFLFTPQPHKSQSKLVPTSADIRPPSLCRLWQPLLIQSASRWLWVLSLPLPHS